MKLRTGILSIAALLSVGAMGAVAATATANSNVVRGTEISYSCTRPLKDGWQWDVGTNKGFIPGDTQQCTFTWSNNDYKRFTIQVDDKYVSGTAGVKTLSLVNSPRYWYAATSDDVVYLTTEGTKALSINGDYLRYYDITHADYEKVAFWTYDDMLEWTAKGCEAQTSAFAKQCLQNLLTPEPIESETSSADTSTEPEDTSTEPVAGSVVTISPSDGEPVTDSDWTILKSGITVAGHGTVTSDQIRVFKSQILTFTISDGNIKEIIFTCTASGTTKYGPGCFAAQTGYSYNGNTGTWVGDASSVTFTASSNQVRITNIKVIYE